MKTYKYLNTEFFSIKKWWVDETIKNYPAIKYSFGFINSEGVGECLFQTTKCREILNYRFAIILATKKLGLDNKPLRLYLKGFENVGNASILSSRTTHLLKNNNLEDIYLIIHINTSFLENFKNNEHIFHEISKEYSLGESKFVYPEGIDEEVTTIFIKLSDEWMSSTLLFGLATLMLRDFLHLNPSNHLDYLNKNITFNNTKPKYFDTILIYRNIDFVKFSSFKDELFKEDPITGIDDDTFFDCCKLDGLNKSFYVKTKFKDYDFNNIINYYDSIKLGKKFTDNNPFCTSLTSHLYSYGLRTIDYGIASIKTKKSITPCFSKVPLKYHSLLAA